MTQHSLKTTDLSDDWGDQAQVCAPLFRDFGGRIEFHGPIATVRCPDDNSKVRELLGQPGAGRVLVIEGGGSPRCALLGDLLAQLAVDNGWAGVLVHGYIRDSAVIATLPFGVKALGTLPRKSEKRNLGETQVVVSFAGVEFRPGDLLYADADGILLLPATAPGAPS
ncbi:MAG: RraA family protein [Gammaproteobacteria bacterium]|jgi:regulator of ribonuclease activity A|nr:ribonuclease E activity regulator RraA [Candidatus Thioaporhodococcus sediminis]TNF57079.1 MAG: RraA family protein [Gammaproteobacteria bacterium]